MSKVLGNPFATQPVQTANRQTIGDVLNDLGTGINQFFAGLDRSLGVTLPESKHLPLRPEYLTYEDDAYDLGWYEDQVLRRRSAENQPEDIFRKYKLVI